MSSIVTQQSCNASNNSNNIELFPLKQGEYLHTSNRVDLANGRMESPTKAWGGRNANSPLPAVPLPAKKSSKRTNINRNHVSCDDLSQISPVHRSSGDDQIQLLRAASMDFDMLGRVASPSQPLLPESNTRGFNPLLHNSVAQRTEDTTVKYTPIHDYEELTEHQRLVQIQQSRHNYNEALLRHQQMPGHQINSIPLSPPVSVTSQQTSDTNRQYPRERQNPMYSGMRAVSPFPHLGESSNKILTKSSVISEKCACALVVGLIAAVVISLLSLIIVVLFAMGILTPMQTPRNDVGSDMKELQASLNDVKIKLNQLDNLAIRSNYTISNLQTKLEAVARNKSQVRIDEIQGQLRDVIQSLSPDQINEIFGNLSGSALSRCEYESYSIGSSPSQVVSYSGEYWATEGYVITGAACSASMDGFVASLETTETDRTHYQCKCVRSSSSPAPSSGRVECQIHFWQCPISPL